MAIKKNRKPVQRKSGIKSMSIIAIYVATVLVILGRGMVKKELGNEVQWSMKLFLDHFLIVTFWNADGVNFDLFLYSPDVKSYRIRVSSTSRY